MFDRIKRLFAPKEQVEEAIVSYAEGDRLLRNGEGWRISPREDRNRVFGAVFLERPVKSRPSAEVK